MAGCMNERPVIKPMTGEQKAFCGVRLLHEKEKPRRVIQEAQDFLKNYPAGDLVLPVKYYMAVNYEKLGERRSAKKVFLEIIESYPASGWAELAESNMRSMEA